MKRVSEWLNELGTHSILECEGAKEDFAKETGKQPPWGDGVTAEHMQFRIDARGKGGSLGPDNGKRLIASVDVAGACYHAFAGDEQAATKMGMGFQFREYVDAIKRNEEKAAESA